MYPYLFTVKSCLFTVIFSNKILPKEEGVRLKFDKLMYEVIKMRELKGDYSVNQHNTLVESHRHMPMTPQQQKIFLTFVSLIDSKNDTDFMKTQISVSEFAELLELKDPNYKKVMPSVHKMSAITVQIPEGTDDVAVISLFHKITYKKKLGIIEAQFHEDLRPFLLHLETQYTTYNLKEIKKLKRTYSIRLYELAMQWQGSKEKKFKHKIEDLKLMFGAVGNSYKEYSNFKLKALQVAIDEIKEKTKLELDYKEIKAGRKVVEIEFTIKKLPTRKKIAKNIDTE